jgi:hypothetical protein
MNKKFKIFGKIVLVVFVLAVALFSFRLWQIKSGRIIKLENGNWISRENFIKAYPPEGTIFPDKNTPFDTYDQFYALIQKGDYDNAVFLINDVDKSRRGMYLKDFKKGGDWLVKWKSHLPLKLDASRLKIEGNYATYNWDWSDGEHHPMDFSKDMDGLWKIDNI